MSRVLWFIQNWNFDSNNNSSENVYINIIIRSAQQHGLHSDCSSNDWTIMKVAITTSWLHASV